MIGVQVFGFELETFIRIRKTLEDYFKANVKDSSWLKKFPYAKNANLLIAEDEGIHYFSLLTKDGEQFHILMYDSRKELLLTSLSSKQYVELVAALPDSISKNDLYCFRFDRTPEICAKEEKQLQTAKAPVVNHSLKAVPYDFNLSAAENMSKQLQSNKGILFFHAHTDEESYTGIIELTKSGNVKHLYIEVSANVFEHVYEVFNRTGDVDFLTRHIKYSGANARYSHLIIKMAKHAYDNGIKVIPVEGATYVVGHLYGEKGPNFQQRLQADEKRENVMAANIIKHAEVLKQDEHFIGLFGEGHSRLAQILQVPSCSLVGFNVAARMPELFEGIGKPIKYQLKIEDGVQDATFNMLVIYQESNTLKNTSSLMKYGLFAAGVAVVGIASYALYMAATDEDVNANLLGPPML